MAPVPLELTAIQAAVIAWGTVERLDSHWNADTTAILTDVSLRVSETWKGQAPTDPLVFHTEGGQVDGMVGWVEDGVFLTEGQVVVVFLRYYDGSLWAGTSYDVAQVSGDEELRHRVQSRVSDALDGSYFLEHPQPLNWEKNLDFDASGVVDLHDFYRFVDAYGDTLSAFDLDRDGHVDLDDFFLFADNFGRPWTEQDVSFADGAVTVAVREQIYGAPVGTGALRWSQVAQVPSISPWPYVTNLGGIGYLTGLHRIGMRCMLADVRPLAELPSLQTLYISSGYIHRIESVGTLQHLADLRVSRALTAAQRADLSWLGSLPELRRLALPRNGLIDVSALAGLTQLQELGLRDNEITDLGPLVDQEDFRPAVLDVRGNPLSREARDIQIPLLQARGIGDLRWTE